MRKILSFSFCICFLIQQGKAQIIGTAKASGTAGYNLYDFSGKPFKSTDYQDVAGTPFLGDGWKLADVDLGQGKKMVGVRTRINAFSNEVHFLATNNEEFSAPPGVVTEIRFADSSQQPPQAIVYKCGFPEIDSLRSVNFYEVISPGKAELLKSIVKTLQERNNEITGDRSRSFETYEALYVFESGTMKRLKKDKSAVLELMLDQKDKVNAFVSANKINFKNTDSLKKLFDYYNSIAN